jgi:hypothetical protein
MKMETKPIEQDEYGNTEDEFLNCEYIGTEPKDPPQWHTGITSFHVCEFEKMQRSFIIPVDITDTCSHFKEKEEAKP